MMAIQALNFRTDIALHITKLDKTKLTPIPLWDVQVSRRIVLQVKKILDYFMKRK